MEKYLVFVEVKYRSNKESGYASAAVDYRKQKRISQAAQSFCCDMAMENRRVGLM